MSARRYLVIGGGLVAALCAATVVEPLDLQNGLWEITESPPPGAPVTDVRVRRVCRTEASTRRFLQILEDSDGPSCARTVTASTPKLLELQRQCRSPRQFTSTFKLEAPDRETLLGTYDATISDNGREAVIHRTLIGRWLDDDCGDVVPRE